LTINTHLHPKNYSCQKMCNLGKNRCAPCILLCTPKLLYPCESLHCMYRAFRFLENLKLYYRVCIPKTNYNGLCVILTLTIRSFLWQLYDKVVRFVLKFIKNSEMLREWYFQEKLLLTYSLYCSILMSKKMKL